MTVEAEPRDPPPAGARAGFHPNVIALGLTSFFTDVSTEMLVPVMPLFITATLGASVGPPSTSFFTSASAASTHLRSWSLRVNVLMRNAPAARCCWKRLEML